jgi:Ca2+-transporting ATPase
MGLTAMSLMHVVAAMEWRDDRVTIFRHSTLANGRFVALVLAVIGLTFLVTTLDGLQRIFGTVELGGPQWRVCLLVTVGYLALVEVVKLVLRRVQPQGAAV